ncbi:MAG: hypothetical protein E6845_17305 [Clostridium sp.]|uniref:hypothetical protein n=1 Tax=Clostridium sp. TaxID=1506 RepID=UPI002900924F|nr:hypothetical protein [Clostridium sp.]MDU1604717.1 hypothetical protein [Clostridium sp.]
MKKHILNNFSKKDNYSNGSKSFYYDELTQVSYLDKDCEVKVMSGYNSSMITKTVETSDPDEFECRISTKSTFTIENSDNDEFNLMGLSRETRVIENSDPDEFYVN